MKQHFGSFKMSIKYKSQWLWKQKNPEKVKEYRRRNRRNHKLYMKEWVKKNPEKIKRYYLESKKDKQRNIQRKYRSYKASAKKRNLDFDLTLNDFKWFWQKPCYYCNDKIEIIGIDRIDNSKGYIKDNVVSCCLTCNKAKLCLSEKGFIEHCYKVVRNYERTH